MLPRTFLAQLIPSRVAEALRRVEAAIWRPATSAAPQVTQTTSFLVHRRLDELDAREFGPVPSVSFHWGPKFSQRWFHLTFPPPDGPETRYLVWEDQAEATAYVAGTPYYGLDLAHRHCPLPSEVTELFLEAVCVKTGIWLNGSALPLDDEGSRYAPPRLLYRNDVAWATYHDLRVLLDVVEAEYDEYQPGAQKPCTDLVRHSPPVLRASPLFRRWCARLDQAIDVLDRDGLASFRAVLAEIYRAHRADSGALKAVLTGHAHIDLVWLWPERVGTFKAVHSWATQVRLLEMYPEFRFGYSQPASYAAVAERAPTLHAQVRKSIAAQRWEATGASYVEFDTQLPCGEALLRALRLGQAAFQQLRGARSTVCWLPDVFGYSGVLPQLLQGFGVEGFFTTKLSWNTVNRLPHTSFRWRGADGAEVVAHIVHLHDYNEAVNVRHLREDILHHQQAAVHPEVLVPTGYGDGGGGPTEEMCERARRLADLAGCPRVTWGGIEPFFQRLKAVAADLPELTGELLFELHRGVFTTHGELKALFRRLERCIQSLEAVHAVLGLGPVPAHYWQRLIFAQFHDYIPGSSIWEVYAEGLGELRALADQALADAQRLLFPSGDAAAVDGWFNPLPFRRTWIEDHQCYTIGPLEGAPRSLLQPRAATAPQVRGLVLESRQVRAAFTASGELTSLVIEGRDLALVGQGHHLAAYPDHPAKFEAWDIDRTSLVSGAPAQLIGEPQADESGLTAHLSFAYKIGHRSRIEVRYSLTAEEPVLRIEYLVDWQDPEMLLKAIFSTAYRGREARFGAPFGSCLRSQWAGYQREEAQWEVPASRWLVVPNDDQSEGLAVITEAKYGVTVRDGQAGVTLLRSPLITGADEHHQIRDTPDRPRHSDLGSHQIRLALGRFTADLPAAEQPAALADLLFTPCVRYGGPAITAGLWDIAGAPSLIPAWGDPVQEGVWILRLHETLGRRGTALLRFAPDWCAFVVRMDVVAPLATSSGATDQLEVPFTPYQIVSVAFSRLSHRA